jgi:hypothetical protein
MATDNLLDVVDELRTLVAELRRLLYGDQASRFPGIVADLDMQKARLDRLTMDMEKLKSKRPVVVMWIGGFWAFVAAIVLIGISFVNASTPANIWDMPPMLAAIFAAGLTALSLFMFIGGFGWLDK